MRKNALMLAVASSLLITAGTAGADTRTTSFGVSATVKPNCQVSAPDLAFGDYDGTATKTSTSNISVRCSSWSDGSTGTGTRVGTGTGMAAGSAQTFAVFGELPNNPLNQGAPSGNYTDTITVTVTY